MKSRILLSLFIILTGYALISNSGGRATTANDGNIGAPGETGTTCVSCHSGGAFGSLIVTLQITDGGGNPISSYTPGTTYNVGVQVSSSSGSPSGYGFQLTSLTGTNMDAGTWQSSITGTTIATANNIGGRTYIEHSSTNASGQFGAQWTSPAAGTGAVTFYYGGIAANGNNMNSGDVAGLATPFTLQEACPAITASIDNIQAVLCFGENTGSIFITPTSGAAPHSFVWSNGQMTEDLMNISAGNYSVTITDANGCSGVVSPVTISESLELMTSISSTNTTCFGVCNGSATVTATGGTGTFSYLWDNGENTNPAVGLCSGVHEVSIEDSNGCVEIASVSINQPSMIIIDLTATQETSPGTNDGTATASVTGGTGNYVYIWDNGAQSNSINGLSPGLYCVTVTDVNGCIEDSCINVDGGVAVNNIPDLKSLIIAPNPTTGQFILEANFKKTIDVKLNILTITGRSVYEQVFTSGEEYRAGIDLSHLAGGLYLIKLQVDDQVAIRKLQLIR